MKSVIFLLLTTALLAGCAKPPEQAYKHPKTGTEHLSEHLTECGDLADKFGFINMSPVHQYPMDDMEDHFQREKVFDYCMRKKGYERNGDLAVGVDPSNTRIRIADSDLVTGETALVTISFSTPVGGLENNDLTVENGSLSPVQSADHGRTWTTVFTPAPEVVDDSNRIQLDNSGVIDGVSNPGRGITVSNNYAINSRQHLVAASANAAAGAP